MEGRSDDDRVTGFTAIEMIGCKAEQQLAFDIEEADLRPGRPSVDQGGRGLPEEAAGSDTEREESETGGELRAVYTPSPPRARCGCNAW